MGSIKNLLEKKEELKVKADAILNNATVEVRGLNAQEKEEFSKIKNEIEGIQNLILELEKRNLNKKDVENMGKNIEKIDLEKRDLLDVVKGEKKEYRTTTATTTANGEVIPTQLYNQVLEKLEEVAPLFALVPKMPCTAGNLEILKETAPEEEAGSFWVGEGDKINFTKIKMDKIKLEQKRCGAGIKLTQHLINASGIDIVNYSINVLTRKLAYALDRAVVSGNKVNSFEGLVNADSNVVTTGTTESIAIEDFMNMINAMHPSLQADSVWVMSRKLFNEVALLQDAIGNFYMLRDVSLVDGKPVYKLFGQPVLINDAVATETTTDTQVCYLVNFERAYAGMIKKDIEFSNICEDTENRVAGTHTLILDIFADAKIADADAIVVLKRK